MEYLRVVGFIPKKVPEVGFHPQQLQGAMDELKVFEEATVGVAALWDQKRSIRTVSSGWTQRVHGRRVEHLSTAKMIAA